MKVFSRIIAVFILFCIGTYDVVAQTDTSKTDMTFDFGLTRSRDVHLWPLVVRTKTQDNSNLQLLFSIYGYKKDFKKLSSTSHLLPLYWNSRDSAGNDLRLLTIYYPSVLRYSNNKSSDSLRSFKFFDLAPQINFMEVTKSTNGTFVQNNLFFFIWYKNDRALDKMYFVTFPLYWSFKSPKRTSSTFIPFYSFGKFNNKKDQYFAVTPLFWHINKEKEKKNVLFPIWWNKKTISDDGISKSNVIFPIFWTTRKPDMVTFSIFPVFSWKHALTYQNDQLIATPLFWHKNNEAECKNTLFPLWWQRTIKAGENPSNTNVIFPIYWYKKDNYVENKVVFPFIWSIRNLQYQSFTFFPLYSKGSSTDKSKSHILFTPFFWQLKDHDSEKNILFPIYWSKKINILIIKYYFLWYGA